MIDVLIVGAGIGGLALAGALSKQGLAVRVLERAPTPSPAGAGIMLAGNARACLSAFGLGEAVVSRGHWLEKMAITDIAGRVLGGMGAPDPTLPEALLALHRRDLHEALLEGAVGAELSTSTSVAALDAEPAGVRVELTTGETVEAKLVIGADGIGSTVRKLAFADAGIERVYAGYTCWRVVVEAELETGGEMWGYGQRVGIIPLREGRTYSFLVENAPAGTPATPLSAADLRARFSGFGGDAPKVLEAIGDDTEILHHDLEQLSAHAYRRGCIGLLGDAAHALTPNMGQGAAMAIEDAYVLAEQVDLHGPTAEALTGYEAARKRRVTGIANQSERIGKVGQWENRFACGVRNTLMRALPASAGAAQVRQLVAAGPAPS